MTAIAAFLSFASWRLGTRGAALVALAMVGATGCASRGSVADPASSGPDRVRGGTALASPEPPADRLAGPSESIVAIHLRKCGSCHARVEPGSLPRTTIEAAMLRHRRRAKLTDREWLDMVDYLSASSGAHAIVQ